MGLIVIIRIFVPMKFLTFSWITSKLSTVSSLLIASRLAEQAKDIKKQKASQENKVIQCNGGCLWVGLIVIIRIFVPMKFLTFLWITSKLSVLSH